MWRAYVFQSVYATQSYVRTSVLYIVYCVRGKYCVIIALGVAYKNQTHDIKTTYIR